MSEGFSFESASTDNHSYSPEKFYTGVGDDGGWRTNVRLQTWAEDLFRELRRVYPPYNTISDLIRDCLVHGTHRLKTDDPKINAIRAQYEQWAELDAERQQQAAIRETYESARQAWQGADTALEIERTRERIESIVATTLDPTWRERFAAILNKK